MVRPWRAWSSPLRKPCSKARVRYCSICSGVRSRSASSAIAASSIIAGSRMPLPGAGAEQPGDISSAILTDAVEREHGGAGTDLLHGGPTQVIAQLGVTGEHDREGSAAVRHHLH